MKRTALALVVISSLSISLVAMLAHINVAFAQDFEAITIKADGSIDPSTAPITRDGNIYTLTGDIFGSITVEKFNIILDGAGYTLQGNGTGRGIQISNPYNATIRSSYDVTVKNFIVKGFEEGIDVFGYGGNIISGVIISQNTVTENEAGIRFSSYNRYTNNIIIGNRIVANNRGLVMEMGHTGNDSGNIVYANQVENNQAGMWFLWHGDYYSWKPNPFEMNNTIYCNNFVNNQQNVVNAHIIYDPDCANIWDNGGEGNYWSDYNGTDANNDGIGDTPYIINANNQDNQPLMKHVVLSRALAVLDTDQFTVDTLPPSISILSPENKTYDTNDIPLNFTVNEAVSQISFTLDGQETGTITGNVTLTGLPMGEHSLTVYAIDAAGNVGSSETINFYVAPFPTTLLIASVITLTVVGIGLIVYFKKRKH